MIVIVFRSRIREGADMPALEALAMRMHECASSMPGFVSYKDFASTDGEIVTIVEFESEPAEGYEGCPALGKDSDLAVTSG